MKCKAENVGKSSGKKLYPWLRQEMMIVCNTAVKGGLREEIQMGYDLVWSGTARPAEK